MLRKLIKMSPSEFLFKSRAYLYLSYEQACFSMGMNRDPDLPSGTIDFEKNIFEKLWISPKDADLLANRLRSKKPNYVQEVQKSADTILGGEITIFGHKIHFESTVPWQTDPLTGKEWPERFHTRVPIFGGNQGYGDIKYVWELNRHHFLTNLGKAYILTKDERYATFGLGLIGDWVRTNPYRVGVNWTSSLEVAVRSLSWCWACAFFQHSKSFTEEHSRIIVRSLLQHIDYIEKHLSFFFSHASMM